MAWRWSAVRPARAWRTARPRWPRAARFAVALTHDVDEVRYASVRDGLRLLGADHGPRGYALRAGLTMVARRLAAPGPGDDP